MDNILKTIMKKGAGIDGHFTNHQGRGACITALLDSDVHPELVCKRTGHRNAKTLFDNYYKQSYQKRVSNTVAVMGGIEENKWGAVPVLPVEEKEVIPREVLSESRENKVPESKATEVVTVDGKEMLLRSCPAPLSNVSVNLPAMKPVPAVEELMCNQQSLWKANNELFREFLEYKKSKCN